MKSKLIIGAVVVMTAVAGNSFAMMGGGGPGTGLMGGGHMGRGVPAPGPGAGMVGAGGMKGSMFGSTMKNGFLDVLAPLATPEDAVTAVDAYITSVNSNLQVAEVWEYQTVYKFELADANGQKAFDVVADKLTGKVTPEMGFSMMMNASWGKQLQVTPRFAKRTLVTPETAAAAVQAFLTKNAAVIEYTVSAQEAYPGYYKFHTTDSLGNPGMDIMVNGYTGGIWMNTQLGAPIAQVQ